MKLAAIICEYNPMHNGHIEHIRYTKQVTKCDGLVCVMSGNFVQRGEPSILDKYTRTRAALRYGADMVVELPTVFAIAGADIFADGAVRVINQIKNVNWLSFGSESGKIDELMHAAQILKTESPELKKTIKDCLNMGLSYPKALSMAVQKKYGQEIGKLASSPNNILAIEYIKALIRHKCAIAPITLKRIGSNYNETELTGKFDSASAIRLAVENSSWNKITSAPKDLIKLYEDNYYDFDKLTQSLSDICLFNIINSSPKELKIFYDFKEGIENRIKSKVQTNHTFDDVATAVKTKRYTLARLKRMLLYPTLKITKELMNTSKKCPPYINVLGIKKEKKGLLNLLTQNYITRKKDVRKIDNQDTLNMLNVNILADDLYCQISQRNKGMFFGHGMIVY
ncbi:MAG TPA: nucleotidyltransferase [Clostridiales bacterium]|jgi:predicted nucleotidyltransferase|nr:nucleotidyltransferase [Clostridiales bacterium]